jgi:hypothetical protein
MTCVVADEPGEPSAQDAPQKESNHGRDAERGEWALSHAYAGSIDKLALQRLQLARIVRNPVGRRAGGISDLVDRPVRSLRHAIDGRRCAVDGACSSCIDCAMRAFCLLVYGFLRQRSHGLLLVAN